MYGEEVSFLVLVCLDIRFRSMIERQNSTFQGQLGIQFKVKGNSNLPVKMVIPGNPMINQISCGQYHTALLDGE